MTEVARLWLSALQLSALQLSALQLSALGLSAGRHPVAQLLSTLLLLPTRPASGMRWAWGLGRHRRRSQQLPESSAVATQLLLQPHLDIITSTPCDETSSCR